MNRYFEARWLVNFPNFYTQISELSLTPPTFSKFLGLTSTLVGSDPQKSCQKSCGRPVEDSVGAWGARDGRVW